MPHISKEELRNRAREYREWWQANTDVPYGYCWCGCGRRTPLAPGSVPARKWVKGEPRRYVDCKTHANRSEREDFLNKYRVEDRGYGTPCWIWTGGVYSTGYGRLKFRGEAYGAHRFFYESEHGLLPSSVQLHHLCENILCVRVSHLQPLSPAKHVHLRHTTKLTKAHVDDIRLLRAVCGFKHRCLAESFGVSRELISQLLRREIWTE